MPTHDRVSDLLGRLAATPQYLTALFTDHSDDDITLWAQLSNLAEQLRTLFA